MKRSFVFLVFGLIAGFRLSPINHTATADGATDVASSSTTASSAQVTGRTSSCSDLEIAVERCRTTAAVSSTTSGDSGDGAHYGDCGGCMLQVPPDRGHNTRSPPPPALSPFSSLIDRRSRRLLVDRQKWRWPQIDGTTTTAAPGYRRVVDLQRPRTKMLKTAEKMILYGMSMFFEKLELAVYLSLYKIRLLYTTLIAPLLS